MRCQDRLALGYPFTDERVGGAGCLWRGSPPSVHGDAWRGNGSRSVTGLIREDPMSVLMTMHVKADGAKIEQEESSEMNAILDKAKQQGLISHHFYSAGDEVLVVDE